MPSVLPPEFADLEPFADWAVPTERARYAKRMSCSMDELQAFYDAAFPRIDDAVAYLESLTLGVAPRRCRAPAVVVLRAHDRVVPGGGVAPASRPR